MVASRQSLLGELVSVGKLSSRIVDRKNLRSKSRRGEEKSKASIRLQRFQRKLE